MTKRERLYKDMKALGEIESKKQRLDMDMDKEGATLKKREVGHGHGQRGSNIEEKRWIKATLKKRDDQNSWTREAHKQGEQAHEL